MAKIKSISIQNFKFFANGANIKLDSKHLLLYGENGSGKSSIYWSIYTLLEAANKENSDDVKKYFDKTNDENLLNINLDQDQATTPVSEISIELDDGHSYKLSLAVTTVLGTEAIQESNWASDFINYRHLLNISYYNHSQEIDLFQYFRYTILPYVKYGTTSIYKEGDQVDTINANEITEYVFNEIGPPQTGTSGVGDNHYPERGSADYTHFDTAFKSSKTELQNLLTYINTEGNPILRDELGYDITFKLTLNDEKYKLNKRSYKPPTFRVILTIPIYEGHTGKINKAQSFLNEAKLTAIALAIRLAVLKKTLATNAGASLKVLVLDDLMISLDMSNREKILDLLMTKYRQSYQIILMTHDRSFFEDAKFHITSGYKNDEERDEEWELLEMYQAKSKEGYPVPFVTKHKTPIQKAYYYFNEHVDYNACGNNLRSALEEHFINFLPSKYLPSKKKRMLGKLIEKAEKYFDFVGYDKDCLIKIERYKSRSLNPTSHYNPKSNFYKKELQDIFEIYETLNRLSNKPLFHTNELISYTVVTEEGDNYTYNFKLLDDICIYDKQDGSDPDILLKDKRSYVLVSYAKNGGQPTVRDDNENDHTLQELYDLTLQKIRDHLHQAPIVETEMKEVFKNENGKSIKSLCEE